MSMLFIQLGREVVPRSLAARANRAVIVGIKNEKFVIIQKQDGSREMVRTNDFVMTENVYDLEDITSNNCDFNNVPAPAAKTNDFDRYMSRLRSKVVSELLEEEGF